MEKPSLQVACIRPNIVSAYEIKTKFYDIGRRFNVSRTLASAMYRSWIDIMSLKLSDVLFGCQEKPQEELCHYHFMTSIQKQLVL